MRSAIVVKFLRGSGHRHQRRHIAPEVEASKIPPGTPDPLLRPAHVLDYQRDEMTCRFDGLALDAKARLEKGIVRWRQGLRTRPGHRSIAVCLAGRASNNQSSILELPAVKHEHLLQHELRWIASGAVVVPLEVEADHLPAFCEQALGPAAEPAVEIDRQVTHDFLSPV